MPKIVGKLTEVEEKEYNGRPFEIIKLWNQGGYTTISNWKEKIKGKYNEGKDWIQVEYTEAKTEKGDYKNLESVQMHEFKKAKETKGFQKESSGRTDRESSILAQSLNRTAAIIHIAEPNITYDIQRKEAIEDYFKTLKEIKVRDEK
jgi:hypothetical protein